MSKDIVSSDKGTETSIAKGASFLFGVTLISVFAGFSLTLARVRKKSPDVFSKHHDEATRLAVKALAYGTVLSCTGCGLLVVVVCKVLGVSTAKEFGDKMRSALPAKDGEFVRKFEGWRIPRKLDDEKWKEEFK